MKAAVRNRSLVSVSVALEDRAKPSLPPVPRSVVEELLVAAERIVAEA